MLSYQRPTKILNTTNETFKIRYCVNLYLNWQRKYERSKLRVPFLLSKFRHLNFDLSYFRCQLRYRFIQYLILKVSLVVLRMKVVLWCDSNFMLWYSILKTANLLHKRGFGKTEVLSTVTTSQPLEVHGQSALFWKPQISDRFYLDVHGGSMTFRVQNP